MKGGSVTIWSQHSFMGRMDNGVEGLTQPDGGALEKAPINTNFSQQVDAQFRLRILLTLQTNVAVTRRVRLRYSRNGGAWTIINTTSNTVRSIATPWYDHQSDATKEIIGPPPPGPPSTWFWANNDNNYRVEAGQNTGGCRYAIQAQGWYMSAEFCLVIRREDVDDADTIRFRLQRVNGDNLNSYLITPIVTVIKPGSVGPARINIKGNNVDIKGGIVNIN